MPDNIVEVYFVASDELSPAVSRMSETVNRNMTGIRSSSQALNEMSDHQEKARRSSDALDRQWNKLTSGTEILASGVMHFRRILEGILWGTIIGAVSVLVTKFIEWATQSSQVAAHLKEVSDQSNRILNMLDPLREKTLAYAKEQYNLYRIEVERAKLNAERLIPDLEKQIAGEKNYADAVSGTAFSFRANVDAIKAWLQYGTMLDTGVLPEMSRKQREALLNAAQLSIELDRQKEILKKSVLPWEEFRNTLSKSGSEWNMLTAQQKEYMKGAYQTVMGFNIQQAAAEQYRASIFSINDVWETLAKQQGMTQEKLGAMIAAYYRNLWDMAQRDKGLRIQAAVDTTTALLNITDALYTMSQGKSKAMFTLWKMAATADAIMRTYQAANQVLADPTLLTWEKAAAMAAVIGMGLANVAKIQATQFGGGATGGGAAGGVSGRAFPSTTATETTTTEQQQPIIVIELHGGDNDIINAMLKNSTFTQKFGAALKRTNGQAGSIIIPIERP